MKHKADGEHWYLKMKTSVKKNTEISCILEANAKKLSTELSEMYYKNIIQYYSWKVTAKADSEHLKMIKIFSILDAKVKRVIDRIKWDFQHD